MAEGENESSHGLNLGFPPLPLAAFFPSSSTDSTPSKLSAAAPPFTNNSPTPPLSPIPRPKTRSGRQASNLSSATSSVPTAPVTVSAPPSDDLRSAAPPSQVRPSKYAIITSGQHSWPDVPNLRPIPSHRPPDYVPLHTKVTPPFISTSLHIPSHEIPPGISIPLAQPSTTAPKVFDTMPNSLPDAPTSTARKVFVDLSNPVLKTANSPHHLIPFPPMLCNPHLSLLVYPPILSSIPTLPSYHSTPNHSPSSGPAISTQPESRLPSSPGHATHSQAPPHGQATSVKQGSGLLSAVAVLPPLLASPVQPSKQTYANVLQSSTPTILRNIPPYLPDIPLEHQPPTLRNGVPSVNFSEEEMEKAEALFSNSLVLKFAGGNPSLWRIKDFVSTWGLVNPYSVAIMDSRHTLVRMTSSSDLKKALSIEVHKLDSTLFRSFTWTPDFNPRKESSMAAVWVQFPSLPFTLFAPTYLHRIAAAIGTPLRLDVPTKEVSRIRFARACIEVDLAKPLPSHIDITTSRHNTFEQPVEYESNVSYCSSCSLRGHSADSCRHAPKLPTGYDSHPHAPTPESLLPTSTPTPPNKTATHIYFPSPSSSTLPSSVHYIPVSTPQKPSLAATVSSPVLPPSLPPSIPITTSTSTAGTPSVSVLPGMAQPAVQVHVTRLQEVAAAPVSIDLSHSFAKPAATHNGSISGDCSGGDTEPSLASFSDGYADDFFSSNVRKKGIRGSSCGGTNQPFITVKRKHRPKQHRPP